uniref:Major facilitator superfamily (MFS) profile domain-containing protein n=1 Tax=Strigamia maritima TaxID=126957 RepID=T1J6T1_STRMM
MSAESSFYLIQIEFDLSTAVSDFKVKCLSVFTVTIEVYVFICCRVSRSSLMTIAAHSSSHVAATRCQQQQKRVLADDDIIIESPLEERVDLTYNTFHDTTIETSAQFFYFSTERPPPPQLVTVLKKQQLLSFSHRQWLVIINFVIVNFCTAACVSLQAPFYPAEAERKGVTSSQYGFVFGVFEFVVFAVSPLYGKYIGHIGHKFLVTAGTFLTSNSCILFGMLDKVYSANTFLTLSFLVRIVEGIGQAAYLTGSFTIIAQEFPNRVATMFAILEAAYGVGLFVGPFIGGVLFEVGGFTLPFLVTGISLLIGTAVTYLILPAAAGAVKKNKLSMFKLLKVPSVAIAGYYTFCASFSLGFLVAVLEPHLRIFELTPKETGTLFVISGGIYAATTPLWGRLSESCLSPIFVSNLGSVFMIFAYLFIGPAPILPFETTLWVCVLGLIFHGMGLASELVGSFGLAHKAAVKYGFPDNIDTYGLVSGYWTSVFAFGAFIGPSVGGILLDVIGFAWGSQVALFFHFIAAERKGATPSEYGFVFGCFELVVFIMSPIYGKYMRHIGPKFMMNAGIFVTAICCIIFGFLNKTPPGTPFLVLSFAIRIIQAMGEAGFITASNTMVVQDFSESRATTFAIMKTSFGFGLIVGPTVGGVLFEAGGFALPFYVVGSIMFLAGIVTFFLIPDREDVEDELTVGGKSLLSAFKVPAVLIASFAVSSTSISIGFTQALLEPHLRQFKLPPTLTGFMFIINGSLYALTSPIWGRLCDKLGNAKLWSAVSAVCMCISFLFLGPAPFFPFDTKLWLCVLALAIQGIGIGGELVAAYVDAMQDVVNYGFPDNLDTYGVVNGIWNSLFAL